MLEVLFIKMLDADEAVFCVAGEDDFVQFGLHRPRISRLSILQYENHQERDDGRSRVDDELPRLGEIENRAGSRPDCDEYDRKHECRGPTRPFGRLAGKAGKEMLRSSHIYLPRYPPQRNSKGGV